MIFENANMVAATSMTTTCIILSRRGVIPIDMTVMTKIVAGSHETATIEKTARLVNELCLNGNFIATNLSPVVTIKLQNIASSKPLLTL